MTNILNLTGADVVLIAVAAMTVAFGAFLAGTGFALWLFPEHRFRR